MGSNNTKSSRWKFITTGYTQKNGAVSIVKTIENAPFICVYPVYAP
jgi:hypothetical protein